MEKLPLEPYVGTPLIKPLFFKAVEARFSVQVGIPVQSPWSKVKWGIVVFAFSFLGGVLQAKYVLDISQTVSKDRHWLRRVWLRPNHVVAEDLGRREADSRVVDNPLKLDNRRTFGEHVQKDAQPNCDSGVSSVFLLFRMDEMRDRIKAVLFCVALLEKFAS